jgi:hypothetical protein
MLRGCYLDKTRTNRQTLHLFTELLHHQIFVVTAYHSTKYYSGDQIMKNEVGGACSTYGGGERCVEDFGGET